MRGGRNLVWFLRSGCEVSAVDESPAAVEQVRRLAAALAPHLPPESFRVADLADLPFSAAAARLGGAWLDPFKTTLVEDLRAMTTWVLRRGE